MPSLKMLLELKQEGLFLRSISFHFHFFPFKLNQHVTIEF